MGANRGYKRSYKNLLLDRNYQLVFTMFMVLTAALFVVAYLLLARAAWRGRARLALAAAVLLACAPYVTPWYLAWVVPLAAVEEDKLARWLALALTAYLLPQTIPL